MNEQINPPPGQRRSGGCCGMGCLSILGLLLFFALALVGGGFWAVQHVKSTYLEEEPRTLPETVASEETAPVEDSNSPGAVASTPAPARETEARWKSFEKAGDHNENGRIELSAGEINGLLQSHRNTRGKAFVSIENNIGHVQVSIPIKNVPLMKGRYLNGEASVEASPDGDPHKVRIFNVVLAKSSVTEGVVEQRFFGLSSMRGYVDQWLNDQNISSFRIENNRAVAETSGPNSITR